MPMLPWLVAGAIARLESYKMMLITICKLKFGDGQTVTGKLQTAAAGAGLVEYSGAIEKLPMRFATAYHTFLEFLFRKLAKELNAELEVKKH